jgi:hypothetical protein
MEILGLIGNDFDKSDYFRQAILPGGISPLLKFE